MQRRIGDMFDEVFPPPPETMLVVTTNSYVRKDGRLVMGRGAARRFAQECASRGFDAALRFGCHVRDAYGHLGTYRFATLWPYRRLGIFQVKWHFNEVASAWLIRGSVSVLKAWCDRHPHVAVNMNYPGIGNGKLPIAQVRPLVKELPDQVVVWTLD